MLTGKVFLALYAECLFLIFEALFAEVLQMRDGSHFKI